MTFSIAAGSSGAALQSFTVAMTTYFEAIAAYIDDPVTNLLPSFETTVNGFDYSVILAEALQGQNDNCSWRTGALVETVHLIVAIQREFTIRQKSKFEYYTDSQADSTLDASYYNALFPKLFSFYRGTSLDGS